MRLLRCAVILVAALTAGSALAQTQRSISDYRVTSLPSQPIPPMQPILTTSALVPAFLPPPPATPPPAVVFQPAPPPPAPVYLPLPPRPTLPTAGGPLDEASSVTAWVRAEALLWWVHGKSLPPVFGGEDPISDARGGGRLTAGMWLNYGSGVIGLEAGYFRLGSQSAGVASATLDATGLSGADAAVRIPVYYVPDNPRPRVDLLLGYRWLHYGEDLSAVEGTSIVVRDQFRVRNDFHGAMLGLAYGGRVGAFTLDVTGRASVGHLSRRVDIDGSTTVGAVESVGGALAQGSNLGAHGEGTWTVIPELELRLGYDVTSSLRVTAGYSVLVLNDFYRAGNVIDTTRPPAFNPSAGVIWVHGLSVGAEMRF